MTAIALPRPRRRKSRPARVAKSAVKTWGSIKVGKTAARAARKGIKWWGSLKVVRFVGRRSPKLLIIPLAAGGGVAAWRKVRSGSAEPSTAPYGSSMGPAATPATVTPPKAAPGSAGGPNGEGTLDDPPAGASNPPVDPPPGATS